MLLSGLWKHRQSWAIGGYCSDMGHNPWHPLYMWKSTVGSWPPKEKFKLFPSLMFAWICIPDHSRPSTKSAPCSPSVHEIDQPPHMSAAASIKLILSWAFRCGKIQRVARELQTIFSMLQWSFNLSKVKDGMHSACAIKLSVDRCLSDLGDAHSWNIYYVFWMVVNIIWYKLTQWKFYPSITSTPYAIYYIPPMKTLILLSPLRPCRSAFLPSSGGVSTQPGLRWTRNVFPDLIVNGIVLSGWHWTIVWLGLEPTGSNLDISEAEAF